MLTMKIMSSVYNIKGTVDENERNVRHKRPCLKVEVIDRVEAKFYFGDQGFLLQYLFSYTYLR